MGFEKIPRSGFENGAQFRGDGVPADGWVDGIWRRSGRMVFAQAWTTPSSLRRSPPPRPYGPAVPV